MTPSQLQALTREQALFVIAHELLHRLLTIEPNAVRIPPAGDGSLFTVTEEGKFLAGLIKEIDAMRGDAYGDE